MKKLILPLLLLLTTVSCKKENTEKSVIYIDNIALERTEAIPIDTIGTQVWMTKNLAVVKYKNGDSIPKVTDPVKWATLTTGAWCNCANVSANGITYGRLYNWYAVNDPRGLAPTGWHIPSVNEWITLVTYLGKGSGGKMKATSLWTLPNVGATNSSGFTALGGGFRQFDGTFSSLGTYCYWWTATEYNANYAWSRFLLNASANADRLNTKKMVGCYVRCLKN